MKYHVRELIDINELHEMMESLYRITGVANALLDTAGEVLIGIGWERACTKFHRVNAESCERCHISDRFIHQHVEVGHHIGYECMNGLFDYAVPVMVNGEHLATMFIGQFLHQPPDMVRFARQAKEYSYDEPEYLAAIRELKVIPRERIADIMDFLVRLAESLGKSGLARMKQLEANAELDRIVHLRTVELEEKINLLKEESAARAVAGKELSESRAELRRLAANQERAKEEERKRIAREIHDELGQALLALRIDVSMLQARTAITHPLLHEKASAALHSIDATVKSVRNIINNLRPAILDLSLGAAIEWQVKEFERRSGIACTLILDDSATLPEESATAVFRILQESLTNIQRHACAAQARVEISTHGDRFVMKVADDGIGIHPDARNKKNAFGLLGIQERVVMIGGMLGIESAEGGGTVLSVSVPRPEILADSRVG